MPEFFEAMRRVHPFVRVHGESVSLHFEGEYIQSAMSQQRPDALEVPYTKTMMGFLLAKPRPQRILMVGLGGGSLTKFCYRHLPEASITVVEISPEVIALRNVFKIPDDDARLKVVCADGADFARESAETFDVILVDGFDAEGQPAQLTTLEFYENCLRRLSSQGVFVANLDTEHPAHTVFVKRAVQTFGHGTVEVQVPERSNSVLFAGKDMPISSRWMSVSVALGTHSEDSRIQLQAEFQRILGALDRFAPLREAGTAQTPRLLQ